ncbi:hypothetical protein V5O48_016357 [Marasmius crinis-equi]|uniref:Uncharacterized protein n=1 Tax=Marasmius crinis-equi TaxID=585013 RepID=A0ABR3ES44_9AGAR
MSTAQGTRIWGVPYVWVVRWFKGDDLSLVEIGLVELGTQRHLESGGDGNGGVVDNTQIERGGREKREKLREKRRWEREQGIWESDEHHEYESEAVAQGTSKLTPPQHQHTHSTSSNTTWQAEEGQDGADRKEKNRLSSIYISIGNVGASIEGYGVTGRGQGSRKRHGAPTPTGGVYDGEVSDPEGPKTPWGCTVKVRRLTGSGRGERLKVVAMLNVSFPSPDVGVDKSALRKREVGRFIPPAGDGHGAGLVLTAEEIKDQMRSTGMWLVVREGFGGVGKISRKGDGWRSRA